MASGPRTTLPQAAAHKSSCRVSATAASWPPRHRRDARSMSWRMSGAPDSLICAQANGIIIGAFKTAAADLMAQVSDSESDFDLKRNLLFFAFGGAYLGAFQYWHETAWKSGFGRHRRDVKPNVHAGTRSTSSSASLPLLKDSPVKAWRRSSRTRRG